MCQLRSRALLALLVAGCTSATAAPSNAPTSVAPVATPGERVLALPMEAPNAETAARRLLGNPANLRTTSVRQSLTGEHVRFAQVAPDGTDIAGAEVSVHFTGAAPRFTARLVLGDLLGPLSLAGARTITADVAGAFAVRVVPRAQEIRVTPGAPIEAISLLADSPAERRLHPGWRVAIDTRGPRHRWEVWVDATDGTAAVRRDLLAAVDGTGSVYQPNPVAETGDTTLKDNNNADSPALTAARRSLPLRDLDGTGVLHGAFADAQNPSSRANEPSLVFDYTRSDDRFEEVNAYFHIDRVQRNLQALGFTGPKAILARPFTVIVNAFPDDNSFYDAMAKAINMGTGGVDDAEDGDVIAHEYGHAIQDDVVPGYGAGAEAGAIGEGFGDIHSASGPVGAPIKTDRACLAPWDSTGYTPPTPCLRRVDGQKHYPEALDGEVHDDGEIWSGAMWDMFTQTGLGEDEGLKTVVEATFQYSTTETMRQSATAVLAADAALHGGANAAVIRRVFTWHGLLADLAPAATFPPVGTRVDGTIQSTHPVANRADLQQTITQPGASAIRVHFASLNMETDAQCPKQKCDNVYLFDGQGNLYQILGGAPAAPFDAVAIPGDSVIVRTISDGSGGSTGWVIDRYEYFTGPVPDGGFPDATPIDAAVPDATPGVLPDGRPVDPGTPDAATHETGGSGGGCGCQVGGSRGRNGSPRAPLGALFGAAILVTLLVRARVRHPARV